MDFSNSEDVRTIVEGCIKGDEGCRQVLYKATYGKMLGVCMRYASNSDEARDLLHDGYIKVFEKIKNFRFTGSVEGWIRKIIVNNVIDTIRRRKKMQFNEDSDTYLNSLSDTSADDLSLIDERTVSADKLVELIQELSPAYKAVFNMYVIEEMSHKEIAEKLHISIGTSKSNLAKAKTKLRTLYIERYGELYE